MEDKYLNTFPITRVVQALVFHINPLAVKEINQLETQLAVQNS